MGSVWWLVGVGDGECVVVGGSGWWVVGGGAVRKTNTQ